ncbi:MAG: hypothetical protein EHM49_00370 [Deltaproteobacteria bacterium]|nr:MAG: hypothetical protein EHM49_00370 [Deltaproteobacteria bacterium]
MAFLIGAATKEEIKEMESLGWEVEKAPEAFADIAVGEDKAVLVYVDNDIAKIIADWSKE